MKNREEGRINMTSVEAGVGRMTEGRPCGCGSVSFLGESLLPSQHSAHAHTCTLLPALGLG